MRLLLEPIASITTDPNYSFLCLRDNNNNKIHLGSLSYILNRTDKFGHSSLIIDDNIFTTVFNVIEDFIEDKDKLYDGFNISKISDLKRPPISQIKIGFFQELEIMALELQFPKYDSEEYLINKLNKRHQDRIRTVYYCVDKDILNKVNISEHDYLRLIDMCIFFKYTLLLTSCFPSITNIELYNDFYKRFVQDVYHEVYNKILYLIKERIREKDLDEEFYYNFSTIIESEIFLNELMYYNVYSISPENNLLNLIDEKIKSMIDKINNGYITHRL